MCCPMSLASPASPTSRTITECSCRRGPTPGLVGRSSSTPAAMITARAVVQAPSVREYDQARAGFSRGNRRRAIDAAADFERCSAELDSDEAAMEAYGCYLERLAELKAAFPNIVCCESFETGECAHGSPCECGWKQAPWPWIVHRPGGQFCDCHMSQRGLWWCFSTAPRGRLIYDGDRSGLDSYPQAGPQRGDGMSGAPAALCLPP